MILWFTGNTGAGKTTLAKRIAEGRRWLDGDECRKKWPELGLSRADRFESCLRIARMARAAEIRGEDVIVSVIAPYRDLRAQIDEICRPVWVYVPGGKQGEDYPYEVPENPHMTVK